LIGLSIVVTTQAQSLQEQQHGHLFFMIMKLRNLHPSAAYLNTTQYDIYDITSNMTNIVPISKNNQVDKDYVTPLLESSVSLN
jgi:hypothetical protein